MKRFKLVLGLSFAAGLAGALGCASGGAGMAARDSRLISGGEIQEASGGVANAYDLVQRLRPRWLQSRGERSTVLATRIAVYRDGQRLGGPDELRLILVADLEEIRYMDSAQAGRLPGTGSDHVEGAILVLSKR